MTASPRKRRAIGLPLLAKELVEQAARRRTYIIRVVYASILFVIGLLIYWDTVYENHASPLSVLGRGEQIFTAVTWMQFVGVYLFMPAITCGVITSEKERNSFGLLLLTRLGPWTILTEKLLGRVVAMAGFILLTMPLLAFAYALGGIDQIRIWAAGWTLLLTSVQVGALALFCSAFFRTTASAFIATYLIGVVMLFGLPFTTLPFPAMRTAIRNVQSQINDLLERGLARLSGISGWDIPFQPVYDHFEELPFAFFAPIVVVGPAGNVHVLQVIVMSVPLAASALFWFLLARAFVVRRAFATASSPLLKLFKGLDGVFARINQNRVTRGITIIDDYATLPEDQPIAWRETRKKSLGTVRYLLRVFLVLEVPVLVVCLLVAILATYDAREMMAMIISLLWLISVLLVSVKATSLVSGERASETLDVLLSTPLGSRSIVLEKYRGVQRLIYVVSIPLLTCALFSTWWRSVGITNGEAILYGFCAISTILIYLPLVAWLSFMIGMRVKSQTRAILGSVGTLVAWCLLPVFLIITFEVVFGHHGPDMDILLLSGPASIIPFNEFDDLDDLGGSEWGVAIINALLYGAAAYVLRTMCIANAAKWLERGEPV